MTCIRPERQRYAVVEIIWDLPLSISMLLLIFLLVSVVNGDGISFESHQLDPVWQDILEEGGLLQSIGKTKRFIGINDNQVDSHCILPNGKAGRCRPVRYCLRDEFRNNYLRFMEYACILNQSGIGVCCPDQRTRGGTEGLAGELPATAPREEQNEAVTKVTRAENRGCGLSTRSQSRVVGSRPANPREWPWMASVTPEGFLQYCGGVLITDRHVLTAAHCTRRWKAEELFVRLGEYDLKRSNDSRTYNFRVVEIRQHEEFELANYRNDIAILKLHRQAVFNTYVWPICLPPPDLPLTNETAIVIGWGTQSYGGPNSNVLLEVSIPVWDHEKCVTSFTETVFEETICAGGHEGGKDACQGDSGGPLMYQMSSGRWAVIGVVSWGVRCGEPNHPGIYARVDNYLDWILLNAKF